MLLKGQQTRLKEAKMQMYSPFSEMPDYAFPRLRRLLADIEPCSELIDMSIGEPKHLYPDFVNEIINSNLSDLNRYPLNDGTEPLIKAIATWATKRYDLDILDYRNRLIILNGSREGLFNSTLSLFPRAKGSKKKYVIIPNPFYQCYLAASIAANAQPIFVSACKDTNYLPNFDAIPKNILEKTGIFFICSPSNPHGTTADFDYWKNLINLSEKYNFRIFSDECYSEIYRHTKPLGIISVAESMGADLEKISVFQSLSKRSNLPGLRSGFSINGKISTQILKKVRAYGGAPLATPFQIASERIWLDENHVKLNRMEYNKKFEVAGHIFKDYHNFKIPGAGFFICLAVDNPVIFTKELWQKTGVKVLPGPYLCNSENLSVSETQKVSSFVRIALVEQEDKVKDGLYKIKNFLLKNTKFVLGSP